MNPNIFIWFFLPRMKRKSKYSILAIIWVCFITLVKVKIKSLSLLFQLFPLSLIGKCSENEDFCPYACIGERTAKNKIYEAVQHDDGFFSHPFNASTLPDCYNECQKNSSSLIVIDKTVLVGECGLY